MKKSGELRSTNIGCLEVESYIPKLTFWKTIFQPLGGAAPLNFYMFQNDQVLLVHLYWGQGSLLQFFSKGLKNWLKI